MKFSEIYKKGYGKPDATDILEGGLCIDIKDQRAYSKGEDGTVFALGLTKEEIIEWLGAETTVVPIGGIIMYSGQISAIPLGWVICNGSNGTPDLRNKFVMGTNIQSDMNSTGGSADSVNISHTHTTGAHNHIGHTEYAGNHSHEYTRTGIKDGSVVRGTGVDYFLHQTWGTSTEGNHNHTVSTDGAVVGIDTAGESGTNKNIPPYVKLAYIMRKS